MLYIKIHTFRIKILAKWKDKPKALVLASNQWALTLICFTYRIT